jgi:hypothetical protein
VNTRAAKTAMGAADRKKSEILGAELVLIGTLGAVNP